MRRPPSPRRRPRLPEASTAVLLALLALRPPPRASAELFCSLEYGVDGSAIGLGAAALNAMRFAEGQSASYLQVSYGPESSFSNLAGRLSRRHIHIEKLDM